MPRSSLEAWDGPVHCLTARPSQDRQVVHVAVTSGQLIPSLAKLLLFRLVGHIDGQQLWSSRHCGKRACFERVRQRFGPAATYVALGARGGGGGGRGSSLHRDGPGGTPGRRYSAGRDVHRSACGWGWGWGWWWWGWCGGVGGVVCVWGGGGARGGGARAPR